MIGYILKIVSQVASQMMLIRLLDKNLSSLLFYSINLAASLLRSTPFITHEVLQTQIRRSGVEKMAINSSHQRIVRLEHVILQ